MDGIEATDAIVTRDPHGPRMLVLTTFEDSDYLHRTLRAGASGFLLKRARPEELVHGVRVVAAGTSLVLPDLTRRLIAEHQPRTGARGAAALPQLTEREADVLSWWSPDCRTPRSRPGSTSVRRRSRPTSAVCWSS